MTRTHPPAPDAAKRVLFPGGLYLILDPAVAGPRSLPDLVGMALAAKVRTFQLRMKTPETGAFYEMASALCPLVQGDGGIFIVNDRCDVALAVGADGVHLGQEDLPLADARAFLGREKRIGVSTHNLTQALEAEAGGADYIGFGPIFPTTTKEKPDTVVGVAGLREVRARVRIPIVAIGGITPRNAAEVMTAGADAVAVVSAVLAAPDPQAALMELLKVVRLNPSPPEGRGLG
ncbi:MAG TPA: thiamine phosphate synthase [Nitrospirales bacterium]|nr:thiamine phosphate synthase [Nitrospirales bacterium]